MDFPWLQTKRVHGGHGARDRVAAEEIAHRAGLLYRLGYSEAAATKRLCARVAWEFDASETGSHGRPDSLSDQAIHKIVTDTYARRPG